MAQPVPGSKDLTLHEEQTLSLIEVPGGDGAFNPDGTVNVVVIRPCEGRGPYSCIYPRDVLEGTAGSWSGYPSYLNHQDPKAQKLAGKLRRGPEELAGELRETVWDPDYTTPEDEKFGYEAGAVVGKFMPANDLVESLIRRIPGQLKLSINAQATSKRRVQRKDGKPGWLVEGIENDPENGSVDLVTAAGAGGHVRSLIESVYGAGHDPSATDGLADLTDDQLVEWLSENRPGLLKPDEPKMPENDLTLQEALQSDEVKGYLNEMIEEGVKTGMQTALQEALPAAVEQERTKIEESVRERLGAGNRIRSLHAEALRLIEAAKLPDSAKELLRSEYAIEESDDGESVTATGSLALIEAVEDDDGKVTKTAKQALGEQIESRVKQLRNLLREAAPTLVHAPGGGSDDGGAPTAAKFGGEQSGWAQRLRSRGLDPANFGATAPTGT